MLKRNITEYQAQSTHQLCHILRNFALATRVSSVHPNYSILDKSWNKWRSQSIRNWTWRGSNI